MKTNRDFQGFLPTELGINTAFASLRDTSRGASGILRNTPGDTSRNISSAATGTMAGAVYFTGYNSHVWKSVISTPIHYIPGRL